MSLATELLDFWKAQSTDMTLDEERRFAALHIFNALEPVAEAFARANPTELVQLYAGPAYVLAWLLSSVDDANLDARIAEVLAKVRHFRTGIKELRELITTKGAGRGRRRKVKGRPTAGARARVKNHARRGHRKTKPRR